MQNDTPIGSAFHSAFPPQGHSFLFVQDLVSLPHCIY